MAPVAIVDLAVPACGAIGEVVYQEMEFLEEDEFQVPVLESIGWGAFAHSDQRVGGGWLEQAREVF